MIIIIFSFCGLGCLVCSNSELISETMNLLDTGKSLLGGWQSLYFDWIIQTQKMREPYVSAILGIGTTPVPCSNGRRPYARPI
jgi:hypothetical protein